jgi:hypothetical protein
MITRVISRVMRDHLFNAEKFLNIVHVCVCAHVQVVVPVICKFLVSVKMTGITGLDNPVYQHSVPGICLLHFYLKTCQTNNNKNLFTYLSAKNSTAWTAVMSKQPLHMNITQNQVWYSATWT